MFSKDTKIKERLNHEVQSSSEGMPPCRKVDLQLWLNISNPPERANHKAHETQKN